MDEIILYLSVTNFKVGEICSRVCYFIITVINNYMVFVVSKILSRQKFNVSIFYSIIFKLLFYKLSAWKLALCIDE